MVSPRTFGMPMLMTARSIMLWAIAGFLCFATLSTQSESKSPALTLESGLGPKVEVTSL